MNVKYYLKDKEFVIEDYNGARPLASFLPGIAGLYGKPLWAFYVNRGQCMASFGTASKEGAIMEFYPANTAYRRTSLEGFRTFVKIRVKGQGSRVKGYGSGGKVYEPFAVHDKGAKGAPVQKLYFSPHEFRIEEIDKRHNIRFEVVYFTIPNEDFPALARILKIENLSGRAMDIEIIDGMPKIEPYGMNDWFMKHMSRTIEAWMEVEGLEEKTPFFRLRVDAADAAEVKHITGGNFYLSLSGETGKRHDVIVDPKTVFGDFGDLTRPGAFEASDFRVPVSQIDRNITPSAFSYHRAGIKRGHSVTVSSLIGHAGSYGELKKISRKLSTGFFTSKRAENKREITRIASSVSVSSGIPEFDLYVRQTNLDNIMRGGYPISVGLPGKEKVIYAFNRKHGDLERDYNNFALPPEFYSQGNGNFRDASQNRRLSVWLNPEVGPKDIKDFYNLIQLDGYNPLIIKGDIFTIEAGKRERLLKKYLPAKGRQDIRDILLRPFTPGDLMKRLHDVGAGSPPARKLIARRRAGKPALTMMVRKADREAFFNELISSSGAMVDAEHGEGYWIDHWTYGLDLVESYLGLFPEDRNALLFKERGCMFFDDAHRIKPRRERYLLNKDKSLRQHHSVFLDGEKNALIGSRKRSACWVRTKLGKGEIYKCSLAAKMLSIIVNKIATLDKRGIGMEMEADKPAWCDSLNGLPGVMGSSVSETIELRRLVVFLLGSLRDAPGARITVPVEIASFTRGLVGELSRNIKGKSRDERYWDRSNAAKEAYRQAVRFGVTGKESAIGAGELSAFLLLCKKKLDRGIKKAYGPEGVIYTYFMDDGKYRALPLSLEGVVHALKVERDTGKARSLYRAVRKSELYDKQFGMYKVNASLAKEPLEIGRIRAFVPGWLENESIWLHMEYKYMLEVLRQGLYEEFYNDLMKAAIPFQDPRRYGRSILENSSFITPSTFFDRDLRGNGFVARLSGSTAEFLHILLIMNLGPAPFSVKDGELIFRPSPVLRKDLFTGEKKYTFTIFGNTLITYINPKMRNTYGKGAVGPVKYRIRYRSGREEVVARGSLGEPFSSDLRKGLVRDISILLDSPFCIC